MDEAVQREGPAAMGGETAGMAAEALGKGGGRVGAVVVAWTMAGWGGLEGPAVTGRLPGDGCGAVS